MCLLVQYSSLVSDYSIILIVLKMYVNIVFLSFNSVALVYQQLMEVNDYDLVHNSALSISTNVGKIV